MTRGRLAYRLALFAMLTLLSGLLPAAHGQVIQQDRIEAAITLQLLTFTEWTEGNSDGIITIGVLENESLFREIQSLLTNDRYKGKFAARLLNFNSPNSSYDTLDALFFSEPNPQEIARTIRRLENEPIVLIASFEGFLEIDGMVNLTIHQKRLRFEINIKNAEERGIKFRAKLLRIATRIIE